MTAPRRAHGLPPGVKDRTESASAGTPACAWRGVKMSLMLSCRRLVPILLPAALALAAACACARGEAPAPAASGAEPGTQDEGATLSKTPDARIEHLVTEDSQVRIEETRVRGVTTSIVVHSKMRGMGSYAIQPTNPALDRQVDPAAGKRLWTWGF